MRKNINKLIKICGLCLVAMTALCTLLLPNAKASAMDIDINASDYGYGDYLVTIHGVGYAGVYDEDTVLFRYYPVYAEVTEDEDTGNYYLDLDYSEDDGTESSGNVASILVNIYDSNGNLVKGISPIKVTPPRTKVELPFADFGLASGTYTIAVTAYNRAGEKLYKDYTITVDYKSIPVPDTGGLFRNLNISRADYLITGLMVFLLVAIAGVVFIAKNNKKNTRARASVRAKSSRRRR